MITRWLRLAALLTGLTSQVAAYAQASFISPSAQYQFALYFYPEYTADPLPSARKEIASQFNDFKLVEKLSETSSQPELSLKLIADVQTSYAPPDLQALKHFGRGLSAENALRIQKCSRALLVNFSSPSAQSFARMRDALRLMAAFAKRFDGLIWDEETRELFTIGAWNEGRISTWQEGPPDIRKQITIHAYQNTEFVRAITLGMGKFGLPDVVVNEFSWSVNASVAKLLNLLAQALIEGVAQNARGVIAIDLTKLHAAASKEEFPRLYEDNHATKLEIHTKKAEPEEGDPYNRILEITFEHIEGTNLQEKQFAFLDQIFGSQDVVTMVKHDKALLQASARAKAKLPGLKNIFQKGLSPGDHLLVKAPFKTPDDRTEWMWVEVIA